MFCIVVNKMGLKQLSSAPTSEDVLKSVLYLAFNDSQNYYTSII